MSVFALLTVAAIATPSSPTTFEFHGQPACVTLTWADGRTRLDNACEQPLLVDQSVHLWAEDRPVGIVLPLASIELRDLNTFTIGLHGTLYRVVAVQPEPVPAGVVPPSPTTAADVSAGETAVLDTAAQQSHQDRATTPASRPSATLGPSAI
jgi:hypothetical protein